MRTIYLTLFLFFNSACMGINKFEEPLLAEISGVWSTSYDLDDFSWYAESLYRKDGTSIHIGKICISNRCKITTVEEVFEIKNGELTSTVVSSSDLDNPIGSVVSEAIKSIDSEILVLINSKGKEYKKQRVHNPEFIKEH